MPRPKRTSINQLTREIFKSKDKNEVRKRLNSIRFRHGLKTYITESGKITSKKTRRR